MADQGLGRWLAPRTSADTDGERSRVLGKLEASGRDIEIARLLANSPTAFRPFILMSDALLMRSSLAPRLRELAVLLLAAESGSSYEREQHEPMAMRAGVTEAECIALRDGTAAVDRFEGDDQVVLQVTAELRANGRCAPETWDRAVAALGAETALELVLAIGWWGGFVPLVLGALGLEAGDGG
jgi:alkylhydroperoxidase family enzyme